MKKVAVTGGLSTGKSTVCNFLKHYGAFVVSADEIVHRFLTFDTAVGKKVVAELGANCLNDGKIDKKSLAKLVFSDPEKLKTLESLLHPAVLDEIEREYERVKNQKQFSFFVAEIPLLFECAWEGRFDLVIAVSAHVELSKTRYIEMRQSDDFFLRTQRQMPLEEKMIRAHLTLTNNGSIEDLENQVRNIIPQLKS